MVATRCLLALRVLLVVFLAFGGSALNDPVAYSTAIPSGANLSIAGAATASGPLAPLWNPAAVVDSPGVHGAASVSLFADGSIARVGASIAALASPTVAWNMIVDPGGNTTLLTFAFPSSANTNLGLAFSYSFVDQGGFSIDAGALFQAGNITIGLSIANIASSLLGGSLPIRVRGGAALHSSAGLRIAADLSLSAAETTLIISGRVKVWVLGFDWWVGIHPTGGLAEIGLGIGFDAFAVPIEISLAVIGDGAAEFIPCVTTSGAVALPAWW